MKISIIGGGLVGSQTALLILLQDVADNVYLYDKDHTKALGEVMDINQCMSVLNNEKECITNDDISIIDDSDIIIVAVGRRRIVNETRTDLFMPNKNDVMDVCNSIKTHAPNAVILMVTNPSDDFAKLARELTSCVVHSIGIELDTARLRELIHMKTSAPRREITSYVSGEHGENMIIHGTDDATAKECTRIAIDTISKKGATIYAPAMSIVNEVRRIIEQDKESEEKK